MFNLPEMTRIVELQARSYALLRWVGDGVGRSALKFGVLHEAMSAGDAARDWLGRNQNSLPPEMRAGDADLSAFANLFASYLTTSFLLKESLPVRRSWCGCHCPICSRLEFVNTLVARQPDKKAQERAKEMKRLYLHGLAEEQGATLSASEFGALLANTELTQPLAYATYGRELLRRSQFASQGEGVLVLWREIAWVNGKSNKKFALSADVIVAAEATLAERLR